MSTPEPCTSWSHNRRHLSVDLDGGGERGREGLALCRPGGVGVNVFDETSINRQLAPYRGSKPAIVVDDLPACKVCEKAAAKLGES